MAMDPYYEQRLRDEVIYLHSLWHQGPPRNPNPNIHYSGSRHLQPSNPTQFKKEKARITPRRKKGKKKPAQSDPPPASDVEWPILSLTTETPSSSAWGWPALNAAPTPATRLPSGEEKARIASTQLQQNALNAAQGFFARNVDSDGDEEYSGSDEDDLTDDDESEEHQFFLKAFREDDKLRGYYEKNCVGGDFYCLVCGGIGEKVGKRFKDCVALVQHSMAIAKTKKKQAHRAYARVICKVLGWNIDRLPSIVLSLSDPLGRSLAKPMESQEDNLQSSVISGTSNVISENVMLSESSSKVGDSCKCMDNLDNAVLNLADGNKERVVNNCPELSKDDGVASQEAMQEYSEENGVGSETKNNQEMIVVVNDPQEVPRI